MILLVIAVVLVLPVLQVIVVVLIFVVIGFLLSTKVEAVTSIELNTVIFGGVKVQESNYRIV